PLAVFIVLGRMARVDWTLEEASADLGADKLTTWRKVIVPVLLPAIMISAALIFPWSFNDFTITYFVAGVGTMTLPIYIFSLMQYCRTPVVINAISSVFVVLPIIGLLLVTFLQRKETT
ncbi:MAG TPA: ABC transporter permease subunit, partial [Dehalococcoidia bacterium]|nr:ABC transporter permease subunit [Dehalococcoidia bacterium]